MRARFGSLLLSAMLGLSAVPPVARAASVACTNWHQTATTQAVMNVCSAQDARRSGGDVAKRYLSYRETLANGRRAALDATQKAWVRYRDTYCAEKGAAVSGGSMQPLVVNECLDTLNRRRANDIAGDRNQR